METITTALFSTDGFLIGTLLPFFFVLLIVVFVHEMGHYLVGRWCGIGAEAFALGFGPELAGFTDKRGTRWKLCAIPLGGYVKFVGDLSGTSTPDDESVTRLSEEERKVAFHTQPVWKRFLTVLAGPVANFILTIVIFSFFFGLYGRSVVEPMVAEVRVESPAALAGLQPGDVFVEVEGSTINAFADVQRIVEGRSEDPLDFKIRRGEELIDVVITPERVEVEDALGNKIKQGLIGVVAKAEVNKFERVEYSPIEAIGVATQETGYVITRTLQFLQRFVVGREDKCQLGGPVKIADMAGKAAQQGFDWLIQLMALLSVGIGILNLMPIPPLDGGHLMFYTAEAALGRPVSSVWRDRAYKMGFYAVMLLIVFVFWNDLVACR